MSKETIEKLRIGYWNIDGAYARIDGNRECKLDSPDIRRELASYDIIGFVETHCAPGDALSFPDFHVISHVRTDTRHTHRHFGGLAILIRRTIKNMVTVLSSNSSELLWIKIGSQFSGLPKNLFVGVVYACPASSSFAARNDDIFELLQNDLAKYRGLGYCVFGGDFNGRTRTELDYLELDAADEHSSSNLDDDHVMLRRRNMDQSSPDSQGKSLLETCRITGMRILNGRLLGDSSGRYTCYSHIGTPSTIDYICADERIFDLFNVFRVHSPMTDLSIHCIIGTSLDCPFRTSRPINVPMHHMTRFRWSPEHDEPYRNHLDTPTFQAKIEQIVTSGESSNNIAISITKLLLDAADAIGVKKNNPRRKNQNSKPRVRSANWFDDDCRSAKRRLRQLSRDIHENPLDISKVLEMRKLSKRYKKLLNSKKQLFKQQTLEQLNDCLSQNKTEYWKIANKLRSMDTRVEPDSIPTHEWIRYFENHMKGGCESQLTQLEMQANVHVTNAPSQNFNELCFTINTDEVDKAIQKLKGGKSPGIDAVSSDMIKAGRTALVPHLAKFFNSILVTGEFPDIWRCNTLSPIHKKGDKALPENYRGIAVSGALCKLFCAVLHARLSAHAMSNNIIPKNQIGYQKGSQTADHIFTLKSMIDKQFEDDSTGKLYTCFVDFKSAFDAVSRPLLMSKLLTFGVGGMFLRTLNNMYYDVKYAFKRGNECSDSFPSHTGVKQGCVLSPLLFNIFVSDLPAQFDETCDPPKLFNESVGSLMFADDLIITSTTPGGMQKALNKLDAYCTRWGLQVNVNKTKIMTFTSSGQVIKSNKFILSGNIVEPVKYYHYLGIVFDCSGSFKQACRHLYEKSLRAMFCLRRINAENNINVAKDLFDHLVLPIASYCSEVWLPYVVGPRKNSPSNFYTESERNPMEMLLSKFGKFLLGVRKNTPNDGVRGELGLPPLMASMIPRIGRYWTRLTRLNPESLVYKALLQSLNGSNSRNWAASVKNILSMIGSQHLWENFGSTQSLVTIGKTLRAKCEKTYKIEYERKLHECEGKLRTYKLFKQCLTTEKYLSVLSSCQRRAFAKFRLSSHRLEIEIGRHHKPKPIPPESRICKHCDLNCVGDEKHAVLHCPTYASTRKSMFEKLQDFTNINDQSDSQKFTFIMSYGEGDTEVLRCIIPLIQEIMLTCK